jgi:hypothetical protein
VVRPDRTHRHRPRWLAAGLVAALGSALVAAPQASAATTPSVNLKLLVIDRSAPGVFDTTTRGVEAELTREGVPFDVVTPAQANVFTTASLEDAANHRALYQGVIMADPFEIDFTAMNIIKDVETRYGLRHVNTNAFPNADAEGLAPVAAATTLDGNPISVTAAGKAAAFGYLAGAMNADDNDPAQAEAQLYLTRAATPAKAGTTFTSLLDVKVGTATGSLASVYTEAGREQLTLTAAGSDDQQWLRVLTPGIINWVTRGVNLGFHRNYFTVQVDDVFLPDSRWSATGKCTPGDSCVDPNVKTTDIRMVPADVTYLNGFTASTGFPLDLAFNGSGSDQVVAANRRDPLMTAFTDPATASLYRWINHTYTHAFLGCIRVEPTVVGQDWRCATPADAPGNVPAAGVNFEDPSLVSDATSDGAHLWLSQARIENEIKTNIDWGKAHLGSTFDPTVLVTGEHSGLVTAPEQPDDNPNLGPALAAQGIVVTASDASRETGPRHVGSTSTLPRHPMNIFYNAGTYQDEVSEYNWIYTSTTDGGSGICSANPATSTCIAALDASTPAAAKASFDSYILPIEIRNAMRYVTSGDSRPFYAHQSNLAEDRILYPVVQGVLSGYGALYNTTVSPLVTSKTVDMEELEHALHRADASSTATAYVDATGVHVTAAAGTQIPLTVPATSTGTTGLSAYDGGLSGWVTATGSDAVMATLDPAGGGYKLAGPAAPTNVTAVADIASATVTWTPSPVNLADVTGWTITATGTPAVAAIPLKPADVKPGATAGTLSYTVTGLKAGASYTFDVFGTNAIGDGPHSAASQPVAILGLPAAPTVTVAGGDGMATVTWTAVPDVTGHPVTGYVVTTMDGTTSTALPATDATTTTLPVTGLTNGTAYTFSVAAVNDLGTGPVGTSAAVTPAAPVTPTPTPTPEPPAPGGGGGVPAPPAPVAPGAPTLGMVTAGDAKIDVTWSAPASDGGSPITDYVVTVYKDADGKVAVTAKTSDTSAAFTGLINGTGYTVEVAAKNVAGVGTASARSAVVTPSTVPVKVTGVSVKRGAASLAVRWKAPANGGSALTGYVVTAYVAKGGKTAATVKVPAKLLAATVKGLKNGTGYTVDVRAINSNGPGVASARSSVVVPATTPGRPSIKATKAGKRGGRSTALVAWRAPSTDGGAAVTGYRITATKYSARGRVLGRTVVTIKSGKVRSAELRLAGGTYRFTVQAVNSVGVGLASGSSKPTVAR